MEEQKLQVKFEVSSSTFGGGDLKKRLEEFGSKVRNKCMRRRCRATVDMLHSDQNAPEEHKSPAAMLTPKLLDIMYLGNFEEQMRGVKVIRKMLSSASPYIDEVIDAGLLPILVSLLRSKSEQMQYEAAWSLTNVVSGNSVQVRYAIEGGAVDYLMRLLTSSNIDVQEQCAWALGNIAGDADDFRDYVVEKGGMPALLNLIKFTDSLRLLQTGAWAVCNLCVNNPHFKSISQSIPVLGSFLGHDNVDFLYNCTLALVHLSEGKERIQSIIDYNVIPPVIKLLDTDKDFLLAHSLKILVNISMGTHNQLDSLVQHDVLQALQKFFDSRKENFRYEVSCVVTNLSAGNLNHIDYVVTSHITFSKILFSIGVDSDRVLKQNVTTLRNISIGGNNSHINALMDKCVIHKLCYALHVPSSGTVYVALVCLDNLLKMGEQKLRNEGTYNHVALGIEECGGLEKIEELQSHSSQSIYHKAYEIMEKYFTAEDMSAIERPKYN